MRTLAKVGRSLDQIGDQRGELQTEATKLEGEKSDLLARVALDDDPGSTKRLPVVRSRLAEIAVELGDLDVQEEAVTEELDRLEAVEREKQRDSWRDRLERLTALRAIAEAHAHEAIQEAADAIAELQEACDAPAREAVKFGQTSRPLPFRPNLLVDEFRSALRKVGVSVRA